MAPGDSSNAPPACPRKPTAMELEILRILWARGPSTVRDVQDTLRPRKALGYTGVLKLLQIMTVKGSVRRDESRRAHVYEACLPAEQTKCQLADDILQRVFEGSPSQLMMHALAGHALAQRELSELRRILERHAGNGETRPLPDIAARIEELLSLPL